MKVEKHRKLDDGSFILVVNTDSSKTTEEGDPDPNYLREFTWPAMPSDGLTKHVDGPKMTQADYVEMQRREAKLLIEADQSQQEKSKEIKIKGEGEDL